MFTRGPSHVDFNLTNGCNLACAHCHSSSGPKLDNELKTPEILKVIKELHEMGTLKIAFAGGEPFIRRDILDILEYSCKLPGWTVSVITNGLFFRDNIVADLKKRCPGLVLNVSIDGSTPDNYTVLRKQLNNPRFDPVPVFEKVKAGVKKVVNEGFETSVNFTITKATIEDILPTYNLAMELGAKSFVGIKFFPGGYGKKHLDEFELPFWLWSQTFSKLTSLKLNGEIPHMQISVPSAWEFYLPLIEGNINLEQAEGIWNYRSPLREKLYSAHTSIGDVLGKMEISVSSNGDVYPTVLLIGEDNARCGNLRKSSMREIWTESPVLNKIRNMDIHDIDGQCEQCKLQEVCGGGSRSRSFSQTKNLNGKDYMCPIVNKGGVLTSV
ncbi:radical SAM/SPASM domain-containing protein [Shouchella lonarensis]|uniref:Radical SAM additional 4Fe4S-binding SPASM domain-containing protein n=1 Tax=Shouchella lonarensis TaxID=1464122 RepID=A0A1G6N1C6_9BACI|nr:radical SAM protein [Shouchella lonarensis]SDC61638.1 radical SAM additional 4Fe4S-binding SPASM domain-containing protein [Shouchella lonarensis]